MAEHTRSICALVSSGNIGSDPTMPGLDTGTAMRMIAMRGGFLTTPCCDSFFHFRG